MKWNGHFQRLAWKNDVGWLSIAFPLDLPWCVIFVPFHPKKSNNFGRNFTYLEDPGIALLTGLCWSFVISIHEQLDDHFPDTEWLANEQYGRSGLHHPQNCREEVFSKVAKLSSFRVFHHFEVVICTSFCFMDMAPSKTWLRGDSILLPFFFPFADLRDLHHKEKVQTFLSQQTKALFWTVWHLP